MEDFFVHRSLVARGLFHDAFDQNVELKHLIRGIPNENMLLKHSFYLRKKIRQLLSAILTPSEVERRLTISFALLLRLDF
jgi:hypothetical protein